ncbi:hypothetical protein F5Y19DRAFT_153729 [Xylariaceae sp. FL1651]|nr:hypothetical protein F5Y19DRAFT_153729 [Xylariaceae sp. FL1651]
MRVSGSWSQKPSMLGERVSFASYGMSGCVSSPAFKVGIPAWLISFRAKAGAGKTVLASIIIAHLFELQESLKYNEGNPRIAYLYLSYKATHTIEQLLGSVIKQFVQDEEPLPQPLVKLWTRRNQGDDPATVKDLSELLRTLFEDRSGYIVVDALDECPPNYRLRLMKVIETQSENLSILVTSRLLDEFDEISKNFERLNIRANPSDLSLFIDHEFDTKSRLRKFSQQDRNLRDEVKEAVRNACDGMFLLASLQMQSLASELSLRGIREKLHNLPKKVEDMYKDTLDRIDKMEDNKRKLALDTLAWIVSSRRPLGINELQHVLAVLPGDSRLDFDHIYQEDDIRDVCGGMVTVTNGVVSLVHYTAQSYFNSIGSSRFPNFHSIIARTCVTYLSLTVLEQPDDEENQMSYADDLDTIPDDRSAAEFFRTHRPGLFSTQRLSFDNKRRIFPFVDYAGPALGYHLRKIPSGSESTDLVSSLIKLLQDRPKRNFFLRVLSEHNLPQPYIRQNLVALADSDKESAYSFNSVDLDDDDILNLQENTEDAQSEHEVDWILKRILEDSDFDSDSDSDAQSTSSQSSASLLGRSTGRSSPLNAEMNTSETDIEPEASSQLGQSEVGDDGEEEGSTAHDSDGEPNTSEIGVPRVVTPLHLAAYLGWKPLITKLVEMPEAVIDINTIDPWDRTPIIIAVNEGNWDVVPILLHHGASVDIMSAEYAYILLHAAQMGRRDVFENLVSQARGPLALQPQDVKFMVALLTAASDFLTFLFLFFSAVSALWNDKTGSLSKVDEEGKEKQSTPESLGNHLQLVEASVSGDVDIINHLIEDGKINFKTQHSVFHIMALFSAVEFNQPMVVQALVDAGADVNMRDFGGNAPLHRAVSRNYVEVVKVLLKAKPDVELKNDDGQTPWSSSLDREHREGKNFAFHDDHIS